MVYRSRGFLFGNLPSLTHFHMTEGENTSFGSLCYVNNHCDAIINNPANTILSECESQLFFTTLIIMTYCDLKLVKRKGG